MNTDYTIKNFRIFDKEGTTADIRPITILTGCNNSGKSSIVKSLCLLRDFCKQMNDDYSTGKDLRLEKYKLDFHKQPFNVMGSFYHVLHDNDDSFKSNEPSDNDKAISFEILVESGILLQYVFLNLEFQSKKEDELKDGYLKSFSIKTLSGETIYKSNCDGTYDFNFEKVKKHLLYFIYGQIFVSQWQYYRPGCDYPQEDIPLDLIEKNLVEELGSFECQKLFEWQFSHCYLSWRDGARGPASPVIHSQRINESFADCPRLGVFSYFPFMSQIKDMEKSDLLKLIQDKLKDSSRSPYNQSNSSPYAKRAVELFIDSFEKSNYNTIHEYVSNEENTYFKSSHVNFKSGRFHWLGLWTDGPISMSVSNNDKHLPEMVDSSVLYTSLDILNQIFQDTNDSYIDVDDYSKSVNYFLLKDLYKMYKRVFCEILTSFGLEDILYTGTNIVQLKRLYSMEEDNEFVNTLKMYFDAMNKSSYIPCTFINKWIKEFGIGDHISIDQLAGGYGVTIRIYKNEEDKEGVLLADKGYGSVHLFALLLKIEVAIMKSCALSRNEYDNRGFTDEFKNSLRSYSELHPVTVALEEPENHLHPSYQSKLADVIAEAYNQYGVHFLVESHSEYLIRKLQLLVASENEEQKLDRDYISILYVYSPSDALKAGEPLVKRIGISKDGYLDDTFGPGFFDEASSLSKQLI